MKLDNIIFDVKPHEVDEAVSLLEKWGYPIVFLGRTNLKKTQSIEAGKDGLILFGYGNTYTMREELEADDTFICTLDELREVTAEIKG